jgi:hypothetical protein
MGFFLECGVKVVVGRVLRAARLLGQAVDHSVVHLFLLLHSHLQVLDLEFKLLYFLLVERLLFKAISFLRSQLQQY